MLDVDAHREQLPHHLSILFSKDTVGQWHRRCSDLVLAVVDAILAGNPHGLQGFAAFKHYLDLSHLMELSLHPTTDLQHHLAIASYLKSIPGYREFDPIQTDIVKEQHGYVQMQIMGCMQAVERSETASSIVEEVFIPFRQLATIALVTQHLSQWPTHPEFPHITALASIIHHASSNLGSITQVTEDLGRIIGSLQTPEMVHRIGFILPPTVIAHLQVAQMHKVLRTAVGQKEHLSEFRKM